MKVKCERIDDGLIPSERIVRLRTLDGNEEEVMVADTQTSEGRYLEVAAIYREGSRVLVELPRESSTGHWRLWLNSSLVVE